MPTTIATDATSPTLAAQQFDSLYQHGFARVAAVTLPCTLADPAANAAAVMQQAQHCHDQGVALAVFPELCLSGYSIDDLLLQDVLLDAVEHQIAHLVEASTQWLTVLLVGAPVRHAGRIYNVALAIQRGQLLGVVPKLYLPNYREFYEHRYFASGAGMGGQQIQIAALTAPFGPDLVFKARDLPGLVIHAEICEDLWLPQAPSASGALAGATVLTNLSASNITVGKASTRHLLCQAQSSRCMAAYLYAAAGNGESTTDLAWDGQATIYENGTLLAATERFPDGGRIAIADIDLDLLRQERARMGTFDDNRRVHDTPFRTVHFALAPPFTNLGLQRNVQRFPFVPANKAQLDQDCYEAYNIQVAGLLQRLRATHTQKLVIGISGGLDSTQALIVAAQTADRLGLPRSNIMAYTLPGFATGNTTKANAWRLMRALGVTAHEIDIRPAAGQMLKDMSHPYSRGEPVYDVTFENVQAGLRTDYLFRLANQHNGLVIGTGDLSELALGWCTYGVGDQMSHYNVNAGLPKTLIQHLLRWVIETAQFAGDVNATLAEILTQEISPELVPVAEGEPLQSTEAKIGPYELQDFNLFYVLRYGFRPSKIAFLALHAWGNVQSGDWPDGFPADARHQYALPVIRSWLQIFVQRFFGFSQFKRSAMPNGPKVVAGGSLSPRGDWRAPSDGNARIWLEELENNIPQ